MIPDDGLLPGAEALAKVKRLTTCPGLPACSLGTQDRESPPPAFHAHVDASNISVGLYLQSETLWFLPPLDNLLAPTRTNLPPPFALASDESVFPPWRPGRGLGLFKPGLDPVVAIRSHVLLEALLRLYARDAAKRVGGFGIAIIGYMELYVDNDGLLDANLLPEPLRSFYKELHDGIMTKSVRQWTRELREALGVRSEGSEDDYS